MSVEEAGSGTGRRDPGEAFAELSRIQLDAQPLAATLVRVAQLAKETLAGAAEASVTLVQTAGMVTVGVTGMVAAELDERQYDEGFGPCMDAAVSGAAVAIPDTAAEDGYRDFAAVARRLGVTGVLSVGLPLDHRIVGSLNVYRTDGGLFDQETVDAIRAFARFAAGAVVNAGAFAEATETARNLRLAMQSRAVIEQAKGILMARHRCPPDEAFELLAAESQRTQRKLRDIARDVVEAVQRPAGADAVRGPGPSGGPRR
jgi:GAF domain-containing protein